VRIGRRLLALAAGIVGAACMVVPLIQAAPASAQVSAVDNGPAGMIEPAVPTIPTPAIPGPSASASAWTQWSAQEQQSLESMPWSAVPGCTIKSVSYSQAPADSEAAYAPSWATITGASIVGTCAIAATSRISTPGAPLPQPGTNTSPAIPSGNTCGGITNGTESVGSFGSNSRYALYQYLGSGSATGHDELSTEGALAQSCYPGNVLANGSTTTLTYGGEEEVVAPWNIAGSNVFDGTWWEGASSPYADWGNVCTAI
jgi:hypothetical protein